MAEAWRAVTTCGIHRRLWHALHQPSYLAAHSCLPQPLCIATLLQWTDGDVWTAAVPLPAGTDVYYKHVRLDKRGGLLGYCSPEGYEADGGEAIKVGRGNGVPRSWGPGHVAIGQRCTDACCDCLTAIQCWLLVALSALLVNLPHATIAHQ